MCCTGTLFVVVSSSILIHLGVDSQPIKDVEIKGIVKSQYACENGVANIYCLPPTVIDVENLFYGRSSENGDDICSNGSPQRDCNMTGFDKTEKFNNLKKACNGKFECNIIANDLTFGDRQKCPNVTKYLNIIYKCSQTPQSSTKEPSTTKETVYYTGTPPPGTSTTEPTTELYIDFHKLDEDGKAWPTPRPIVECNIITVNDSSDDDEFNSASSIKGHMCLVIAILIWQFI